MNREHVAKLERDNISNTFWWGCSCGQGDSAWAYEARARAAMEQHLASVAGAPPVKTPITDSRTGWWDPHTGGLTSRKKRRRSGEPTAATGGELDPELLAMSTIAPLMDALEPGARRRVTRWVEDRWYA